MAAWTCPQLAIATPGQQVLGAVPVKNMQTLLCYKIQSPDINPAPFTSQQGSTGLQPDETHCTRQRQHQQVSIVRTQGSW